MAERLRAWVAGRHRGVLPGIDGELWNWLADESGVPYGQDFDGNPLQPASLMAADIAESIAYAEVAVANPADPAFERVDYFENLATIAWQILEDRIALCR